MRTRLIVLAAASVLSFGVTHSASAAMAVVDVAAIARLVQQIRTLQEQLTTARDQLRQAQDAFRAMTGPRGMEQLLGNTVRNYLPPDWAELDAVMRSASVTYRQLSNELDVLIAQNAVLSANELAGLSPAQRDQIAEARRSAALLQALARRALQTSSERFASVQALINAIPGASDQKAILDLQARIAAEQGMLQNEEIKLDVLYQTTTAERLARQQRLRERAIQDVGSLRSLPAMGL